MSDLDDILAAGPGKREPIPEDKLLAYLEGRLSPAEQHEVEEWFAGEGMESDAIEGLASLPQGDVRQAVNKINSKLGKSMNARRRRRKPLNTNEYTILAIGIILMLGIVAFIIIKMQK